MLMMSDDVRYAFAALGLTPEAPLTTVRRRYKALVRVRHPDRFASDPQAVADATIKMRVINRAYQRILETHEAEQRAAAVRPPMLTSRGERDAEVRLESLRPEEIDEMWTPSTADPRGASVFERIPGIDAFRCLSPLRTRRTSY